MIMMVVQQIYPEKEQIPTFKWAPCSMFCSLLDIKLNSIGCCQQTEDSHLICYFKRLATAGQSEASYMVCIDSHYILSYVFYYDAKMISFIGIIWIFPHQHFQVYVEMWVQFLHRLRDTRILYT